MLCFDFFLTEMIVSLFAKSHKLGLFGSNSDDDDDASND